MLRNWIGFFSVLCGSVVVMTTGCANEDFTSCEANANCAGGGGTDGGLGGASGSGGTSGASGTSGTSGQGGQAGDGGGCDTSADPSTESCLIADDHAIFVDGTASTSGDGSKASPFKTIGEGLAAAKTSGKLVLVCDTDYDEQVKIDAGARLYGGFKCSDWTYETGQKAVVKPSAKGYALEVANVTSPVVIQDMEFDAQDGTDPGESSIAAFVHDSTGVAFDRVSFVAGTGAKGKDGVLVPVTFETIQTKLNGLPADQDNGGNGQTCACQAGGQSKGGGGGDLAQGGGNGLPAIGGGQGSTASQCTSSSIGGSKGADATAKAAASGAPTVGTLTSSGFSGSNGGDGANGDPGQGGGGGGGAETQSPGGGGGGGCGGCGGAGGPGGGAGGSSVALMVFASTVQTNNCSFTATTAGDGGKGAAGQPGATQVGGGGNPATFGCKGGTGGKGGAGGAGGGGAGGISAGVLSDAGSTFTDNGGTFAHDAAGQAGAGGDSTNAGIAGLADDKVQL